MKLLMTLFTLVVISICIGLGGWQLHRAETKRLLLATYEERQQIKPLELKELLKKTDRSYYRLKVVGRYDNAHPILVENKIVQHQLGYYVVLPFVLRGQNKCILVNQGWIPQPQDANAPPTLVPNKDVLALLGTVVVPEKSFMLGENINKKPWPLYIQQIDIPTLAKLTHHDFYPFVLSLPPQNPVQIKPAVHIGYAIQWFLIAAALFIFYLIKKFKKLL